MENLQIVDVYPIDESLQSTSNKKITVRVLATLNLIGSMYDIFIYMYHKNQPFV